MERYDFDDKVVKAIKIIGLGNESNDWTSIVEVQPYGCGFNAIESTGDGSELVREKGVSVYGLRTDAPPSQNFDLSRWKITIPTDNDGDGSADEIKEQELSSGWNNEEIFYTDPFSGGMVFRSDPSNASTTPNSSYARAELREMMRAGDESIQTRMDGDYSSKNNWVFGSAPQEAQDAAGGVDGKMTAKLAINQVTRLGESGHVGRFIIGQIHAKDAEPIRLYYRKLPTNKYGSVYYIHEVPGGTDKAVELIGSRDDFAPNPEDGIALDEIFEYSIEVSTKMVDGAAHSILDVSITRDDGTVITAPSLDMHGTSYSDAGEFMYFKAGAYSQNNTSNWPGRDVDQATFFELTVTH
ncbi:MAG: polysaccharide lyase family 7 protein [Thalassovita sp.]